jgi:nucleotide-binding universal stress UspA family protein
LPREEDKKVLIALDYDPTAQKVAETGYSLAKAMGAEIILLHVISNPADYSSGKNVTIMGFAGYSDIDSLKLVSIEVLKNKSQHFMEKSKHHLGDDTIQTLVKEGDIPEEILKTSKDLHIDVIVMGSHSRRWLEEVLMGSVTEEVLHHSITPLFIIPTKKQT